MNWFTWTLLLFQTTLFSFAHPYSSTNESCNYARGCGIDITQTQCEQRNCCYRPSIIRRHNCFQRQLPSEENLPVIGNHNTPSTTQQPNILNGEMEPPDAFHLPPQMEEYINMFTHTGDNQLTPAQALHIANTVSMIDLNANTFYFNSFTALRVFLSVANDGNYIQFLKSFILE
ncbi:uncharacterized protein LOC144745956 [Ciona intestinalis]